MAMLVLIVAGTATVIISEFVVTMVILILYTDTNTKSNSSRKDNP